MFLGLSLAVNNPSGGSGEIDPSAPVFNSPPSIAGDPYIDTSLTGTPGSVSAYPEATRLYQWQSSADDGETWDDIVGEDELELALIEDYEGLLIRLEETATNSEDSVVEVSNEIGPIDFAPEIAQFTSPSSISGTQQVGFVQTCTPGARTGYPTPTLAYQWYHVGGLDIDGATSSTYTPDEDDVGEILGCRVTATNASGSDESIAESSGPIDFAHAAPSFTTQSTIDGSIVVDNELVAVPGTVTGYPTPVLGYQWRKDTVNIPGATNFNYVTVEADIGAMIDCVITATNIVDDDTDTATAVGPIEDNVVNEAPEFTGTTTIAGGTYIDDTWTVTPSEVTGVPTPTLSYKWQTFVDPNWEDIVGETGTTFTPDASFEGATFRCLVTATNIVDTDTSASSGVGPLDFAPEAPVFTSDIVIAGDPTEGETLTATPGTVTGYPTPTSTYQWQADNGGGWDDIVDEDGLTLVLTSGLVGSDIRCIQTATNASDSATSTSNVLGPVEEIPTGEAPVFTTESVIFGNAEVGQDLSCEIGTFTGSPTPTATYQWQHDDGGGWAAISGATASTWTVVDTYLGEDIRCLTTIDNGVGSPDTSASNVLGPIPEVGIPPTPIMGTPQASDGDITLAWPTHEAGQIGLMWLETANQAAAPDGSWTQVASSPQSGGTAGAAAGVRGAIYAKVATSNAEANVTITDPGDHVVGVIGVIPYNQSLANLVNASAGNITSFASNPYTLPSPTTDVDNCRILCSVFPRTDTTTLQSSNWACADGTPQEHLDFQSNVGNGGGISIASFIKETAGTVATITVDQVTVNATLPKIVLALEPLAADFGPTNSVAPSITGTLTEGQTINLNNGTWNDGSPDGTFTRNLYADDVLIAADVGTTFELTSSEVGKMLRLDVICNNGIGNVKVASSEVGPVAPFDPPVEGKVHGSEFGIEFE